MKRICYFSGTQTDLAPPEAVVVMVVAVRNSRVIFITHRIAYHRAAGTFFSIDKNGNSGNK
ncbi:hypothetical protein CQW29_15365 [Pantoea coffeiphila]|uniref:Uncharacterized protein n=1 Tax=Pantoea coffeiphila TaxID=1465635 RepID=A0A2S9I9T5_9GAMM|nr:hypothetical protein CQW29_15365 [Pantoea coffeiphila]